MRGRNHIRSTLSPASNFNSLLEAMGYVFRDGQWMAPPIGWLSPAAAEADAMHVLLVLRADQLDGCTEGSPEETQK